MKSITGRRTRSKFLARLTIQEAAAEPLRIVGYAPLVSLLTVCCGAVGSAAAQAHLVRALPLAAQECTLAQGRVANKAEVERKLQKERDAKNRAVWQELARRHPFLYDPKARARLSIVAKSPPLSDVLDQLRKATGLQLVVADNLMNHDPDLGDMRLPKVLALSLLQLIADADLDKGRWVKIDGGYRLEGVSKRARATSPHGGTSQPHDADSGAKMPLRRDSRLAVRLNIFAEDPPVGEILDELRTATTLDLVLADDLTRHDPRLGELVMRNAPAFSFMEMIAERDLENGRWVKTDTGYRLEGVSKRLRPLPPP
ncbi:MAG: hypothetical protein L0Y71_22355, partial [Gemmataceae bacterium]|nr:hypothetical protein [Gemmataceae bacterium]